MKTTFKRWTRTLIIMALVILIAMPTGLASAVPKAITRATSVRVESTAKVYIGNDGIGSTHTLSHSILPAAASANRDSSLRAWSSDDTRVVTVSASGVIKAVNFGTTYVRLHLEDGTGLESKCKVTVSKQPVLTITLDHAERSSLPGKKVQLTAKVTPANAYSQTVKWTTGNKKLATVDQTGLVKLIKPGVVKITATCGKVYAKCTFTVGYDFEKAKFRLVTISNDNYPASIGKTPAWKAGADTIHEYFRQMYDEGPMPSITRFENQTGAQMRAIIANLANYKLTTEADVFIVYYSGRASTGADTKGALLGIDGDKASGIVTIAEVQAMLDKVPGTVILILDCQMAGQWIKVKGAQDFNQAVINQFRSSTATNYVPKAIEGSTRSKYKIIAACGGNGKVYGVLGGEDEDEDVDDLEGGDGYTLFSKTLARAFDGKADTNQDGIITLREIEKYAIARLQTEVKAYNKAFKKNVTQKLNIWPLNDYIPVFVGGGEDDDDD